MTTLLCACLPKSLMCHGIITTLQQAESCTAFSSKLRHTKLHDGAVQATTASLLELHMRVALTCGLSCEVPCARHLAPWDTTSAAQRAWRQVRELPAAWRASGLLTMLSGMASTGVQDARHWYKTVAACSVLLAAQSATGGERSLATVWPPPTCAVSMNNSATVRPPQHMLIVYPPPLARRTAGDLSECSEVCARIMQLLLIHIGGQEALVLRAFLRPHSTPTDSGAGGGTHHAVSQSAAAAEVQSGLAASAAGGQVNIYLALALSMDTEKRVADKYQQQLR